MQICSALLWISEIGFFVRSFQNVKPNHKFSSTFDYDPWVLFCGVKIVEPVNYNW